MKMPPRLQYFVLLSDAREYAAVLRRDGFPQADVTLSMLLYTPDFVVLRDGAPLVVHGVSLEELTGT